ncbi:UDP-N-acetylmuramoyl-L-alanyl-D-glutamate--2,6-diaminopimelate ligase [Aquipuribacter hungaricus]|uniref:UDP-N-acetylmuramoyl-L-alanyl-D-glutamate--2,6-diaminopimelate ligase n=1 Tax=Aquipuribacter hungaricus TaxID=545624 RepID=A0ABV7WKB6_9MICO
MPTPPPTVRELAERHSLRLRSTAPQGPGTGPDQDPATGPTGADQHVVGVSLDSRRAGPGQLWAALPGSTTHGARHARQALDAGAVAVLTDPEGARLVAGEAGERGTCLLVTDDPRSSLGPVAADVHGHPSEQLALVGVTGTNGKTTVSTLVDELLRSLGATTGLIGTIRARVGATELASSFTTPEAPDLQALLRQMVDAGCTVATTEVSSHALAQRRVDGTRFALAVWTNLSRDHLDFHGTLAAYFSAKLRLFTGGFAPRAVVAVDDAWGHEVAALARERGMRVLTVGTVTGPAGRRGTAPDVGVRAVATTAAGAQTVELDGPFGDGGARTTLTVTTGMPGPFNAVNVALALTSVHLLLEDAPGGAALDLGRRVPATELAAAVGAVPGVPGRMERVVLPGEDGCPLVVVDYAHTPDAVAGAVAALRGATPGRLVVVLGAGGDRDQGKRAGMGRAASGADLVVVTDDNPRTEDPAVVRAAVLAGVTVEAVEVGDRAEAVRVALSRCTGPSDTVLLAGKGHETGQSAGGSVAPFDDRDVARQALAAWLRHRAGEQA